MKIAVIDNYDSFVFNIVRYLEESFVGEIIVFRNNEIDEEKLKNVNGILLSPGPGVPSEAGNLMQVISNYHQTTPILGICLGHQAIAEFFGGKLVQDMTPYHGKISLIVHDGKSKFFEKVPTSTKVGRYHSWHVDSHLPTTLKETAKTADGKLMAMEHQALNIIGIQFHPESIMTPFGRRMISNWVKTITKTT